MNKKRYKNKKSVYPPFILIGMGAYSLTRNPVDVIIFTLISILIYISIKNMLKEKARKKYLTSGIDIVDNLTGKQFEEFLLAHFENLGYKGELTPDTNDYGADLILKKDGERIVVQAKRYTKKVGIEAIQQIIGAREYYKATKGLVVTNNYFTPNALNLALSSNIEMWDRTKLLNIMTKANGREKIIQSFGEDVEKKRICKKCNSEMVIKKGRYGEFYGCMNYPKCTYTEKLN